MLASQVRDGGRGYDSGIFNLGAAFSQAGCDGVGNPAGGLARVHAQENFRLRVRAVELMSEGESNCVDGLSIERCYAGHRADAVRAEQLSHEPCASFSTAVTRLRMRPRASRATID